MKLIDVTCPHCGATLKVDPASKSAKCEYCGASFLIDDEVQHVQYDDAEKAGYEFEKGRQRAQKEAQRASQSDYRPQQPKQPEKKNPWIMILWIFGWICIFPLPLTILLLRKKDMKPAVKYGIIAAAWIIYLIIGLSGKSNKNDTRSTSQTTATNPIVDSLTDDTGNASKDSSVASDVSTEGSAIIESSTESDADKESLQSSEIVYKDNVKINEFLVGFNQAYPEYAISADDLEKYYHHGKEHDNQVKTAIDGVPVLISDEGSGVSVYWNNPDPSSNDGNLKMFQIVMHVFAPDLDDTEIMARWQEVLDSDTGSVRYDDGIEFSSLVNGNGFFEYIKITV